jgi:hypothetical protein
MENSVGFGASSDPQVLEATGPQIFTVTGDPNGTVTAPQGSLAIQRDSAALWQNTDGSSTWTLAGGGSGGGTGSVVELLGLDTVVNEAPVVAQGVSRAIGSATVNTAPLAVGDSITIGGNPLTGVAGPRTSGANDFDASLVTAAALAREIVEAINDPANALQDSVAAFPSFAPGVVTIEDRRGGISGNSVTLSALTVPPGGITVSGPTLTGGGTLVPTTLTFEAAPVDLLLKQLFVFAAADQVLDATAFLRLTSLSIDGGPNLLSGVLPLPLVGATTPASTPELDLALPAGSVVSIIVEMLAGLGALLTATWSAIPLPSTLPSARSLLGAPDVVTSVAGVDAQALLTVGPGSPGSPAPGDVLLFKGVGSESQALTGTGGPRTSGADDFDTTGPDSAVVASIVAAVNDPANSFPSYTATDLDPVIRFEIGGGSFPNSFGPGAGAGNTIEVYSNGMGPNPLSFSGGTNPVATVVFVAAPEDLYLERLYFVAIAGEGITVFADLLIVTSISIDGGPNLIDGPITGAILNAGGLAAAPLLDIPIDSGSVVTVLVETPGIPGTAVFAGWVTRVRP